MSRLKHIRERSNLTQEELAEKSTISVRTIQRIESGIEPKGKTLKILAETLEVKQDELLTPNHTIQEKTDLTLTKLINLSSLPFSILPPLNIIIPLAIMFGRKQFYPLAKQIVSLQMVWLIVAAIIFMLGSFVKNWLMLNSAFILVIMTLLVLSNVFIILRNTAEIDKKGELYFRLNFSII